MKSPAHFLALVALLSTSLRAQDSAVKPPALTEAAPVLKPGLALTFTAGGKSDTRTAQIGRAHV